MPARNPEFRAVGLDAIEHVLPARKVTTEHLAATFVNDDGEPLISGRALKRLTGVAERRWADPGICSSDLAAAAASKALAAVGVDPLEVDVLLFASASHDLAEPATANRVQMLTGCRSARALDVKNACNSFLDGLDLARIMVASGSAHTVLIATGEVISPFVQQTPIPGVEWSHLVAGLTLGDAGAAAVVRPWTKSSIARVLPGCFRTLGENWDGSRIMAGGSMTGRDFSGAYFWSDSTSILGLAVTHVPPVLLEALESVGWGHADVDLVVPHQASVAVIRSICDVSGIDFERCVVTAHFLGNTAAASIPVALSMAKESGRLDEAERLVLVGGAAGFSAAAIPLAIVDI